MKKKIIIAITLMLIAFGAYRGTMAVFHEETNVDAPISAGTLGIEIMNASTNTITDHVSFENTLPGAIVEDNVRIRNTKDKDAYVRITLTRYWVDENGKKITDAKAEYIKPNTKNTQDWIIVNDEKANNEIVYFYSKAPVMAKESTSDFLNTIEFDSEINAQYQNYKANIILEAEAVQMIGAQDAIVSQWGVEVSMDDKGNIINVLEQ